MGIGSGNRSKLEAVPVTQPPVAFGQRVIGIEYLDAVYKWMQQILAWRDIFMPVRMGPYDCRKGKVFPYIFQRSASFDRNIGTIDKDVAQFRSSYFLAG